MSLQQKKLITYIYIRELTICQEVEQFKVLHGP